MKPTFIKGKWALTLTILDRQSRNWNSHYKSWASFGLSLESHFDDFEGLHERRLVTILHLGLITCDHAIEEGKEPIGSTHE